MYDLLCVSDCCCDMIFQGLPRLPQAGGEEYCRAFSLHAGGGANTPIAAARLGCDTAYATTVGDDLLGGVVLREMLASGISREFIRTPENAATWISAVLSTAQDRAFASCAGASADYSPQELDRMVSQARWVHTYAYYCEKYACLQDVCAERGVPLSMDLAYDPSRTLDDIAPLLRKATLITPNCREACAITGEKDARAALERLHALCPNVVITMGGDGCIAALDGGFYRAHAPQVDVVDTNGAGDLFNAGLLAARLKGLRADEQLRMACASGSVAVTCVGSMDARYQPESVEALAARIRVEPI